MCSGLHDPHKPLCEHSFHSFPFHCPCFFSNGSGAGFVDQVGSYPGEDNGLEFIRLGV